jgi:ferritin-like metal-binding protein YciE
MARVTNPKELFVHKLGTMLTVEQQLLEIIPTLVEEASDEELRDRLEHHHEQTRGHIENLERVFEKLGEEPKAQDSPAIEGLRRQHEATVNEVATDLLDGVVASSAVASEHLEIASYMALMTMAEALDESQIVNLLKKNLDEEKEALNEAEKAARRASKESAKIYAER